MKKNKILESLLALDKKSSNRYELATLYEACNLKEEDKEELVKYIDSYEHPSIIGQFLQSKCDGICEAICDDDDVSDLKTATKFVDEINDEEIEPVLTFDDLTDEDDCEIVLNESVVKEGSKEVASYVWNKVKDIDAITDDDSLYWRFDDSLRQGDAAKIITDESDLPDNATYKFSLVEVDINLYYDWEDECWYVLDKTYETPAIEEAVDGTGDKWEIEYNNGAVQRCPMPNKTKIIEGTWEEVLEELDSMYVEIPGEYDDDDNIICSLQQFIAEYEENADLSGSTVVLRITKNGKVVFEITNYKDWNDGLDESVEIHECPICGRNFAEHEVSGGTCPKCGEEIHKTDSGEYEKTDNDLDEGMQKDLERRYVIEKAHTNKSVLSNIDTLLSSELVKSIEPVTLHNTEMFKLTGADGREFYLIPTTMSQFDIYDTDENLIVRSEFTRTIPDEILGDKFNLEFIYELVGGDCEGTYDDVEDLPCFSGNYTEDQSDIRARGGFTSRPELDNKPILNGYVGPMMNGYKDHKMVLRYETQEIYDRLSEALFELEQDWTDYCPHCTNRSLAITDEHNDIAKCDSCGAEYQVVPVGNGKVRMLELNEGVLDDIKKVGKTVGQIAKERWDDSYTKAIATGVKKNLAKSRLGQDLKRIGKSIKDTDTYKKVAGKVNDIKQTIKDNKHDDNRKPQDISVNVRGKDYRVSDLKYKLNGKTISPEEVAKMSAFERKKVKIIVPRTAKPLPEKQNEGLFEEFPHTHMFIDLAAVALDVWNELQPEKLGEDRWVEFDFREPHIVDGKQVLSFDAIGPEKHLWGKLVDEQNSIRVVLRNSDEEAICEDVDDIIEFILEQHGVNEVVEGYFSDDDFEDDIEHANLYGGDTMYCRDCGAKKKYDDDGFTYCPECNDKVEL